MDDRLQKLKDFLTLNEAVWWRIETVGQGSACVAHSGEEPALTQDASFVMLEKAWDFIPSGRYFLKANKLLHSATTAAKMPKNTFTIQFDKEVTSATIAGVGPQQPQVDIQAEIQRGINDYEVRRERNELAEKLKKAEELATAKEKEAADLRKQIDESPDTFGQFIQGIQPHMGDLIQVFMGRGKAVATAAIPAAVSGTPIEIQGTGDEETMSKALEQMHTAEPRLPELLEKLGAMAINDPQKFKQYSAMLLTM